LNKEKVPVVGLGEVGRVLSELLGEKELLAVYGLDTDEEKMRRVEQSSEVRSLPFLSCSWAPVFFLVPWYWRIRLLSDADHISAQIKIGQAE
jgi:prephenate dehydrogenase